MDQIRRCFAILDPDGRRRLLLVAAGPRALAKHGDRRCQNHTKRDRPLQRAEADSPLGAQGVYDVCCEAENCCLNSIHGLADGNLLLNFFL